MVIREKRKKLQFEYELLFCLSSEMSTPSSGLQWDFVLHQIDDDDHISLLIIYEICILTYGRKRKKE